MLNVLMEVNKIVCGSDLNSVVREKKIQSSLDVMF